MLAFALVPGCGRSYSGGRDSGNDLGQSGQAGAGSGATTPGGSDPNGHDPSVAPLVERSFAVTGSVELVEPDADFGVRGCTSFDFTARFVHDAEAGWVLMTAVSGEQSGAALEASGAAYRAVGSTTPAKLGAHDDRAVLELPMVECCQRLFVTGLTLSPEVDAEDGSIVGFSAVGPASSESDCGGDYILQNEVRLKLHGAPDHVSPRVIFPDGPLHPFEPLELPFSEVVSGETQASLIDTEEVALPLARVGYLVPDGPFWGFRSGPLMSFGRVANLEIQGRDWAGNPFLGGGRVASEEDPGVLPADGFESDVPALGEFAPEIVDRIALTGAKSLKIGGDPAGRGRVTFHLRSAESAKFVRFSAQNLAMDGGGDDEEVSGVEVDAAALGGREIVSIRVSLDDVTSPAKAAEFPALQSLELELPEPTTDAIVSFQLEPHSSECGLISCYDIPALIDDLRLE